MEQEFYCLLGVYEHTECVQINDITLIITLLSFACIIREMTAATNQQKLLFEMQYVHASLTNREVKMARYWPSSFSHFYRMGQSRGQ